MSEGQSSVMMKVVVVCLMYKGKGEEVVEYTTINEAMVSVLCGEGSG